MKRRVVRPLDLSNRFDFEKLEDRNLLSGSSELIHVNLDHSTAIPVITSGDPNGTPPVTPADLIDPNVAESPFAGVVAVSPNGGGVCSGAVLSPTVILTAGHCVDFNDNGVADISLTTTEVHFNHQASEVVYVGIAAAIAHPDYTGFANPTVNDDIALLILNQPIPSGVPIYKFNTTEWTNPELIYLAGYGTSGDAINGYSIGAGLDDKRVGQNLASGFELDDEGSGVRELFLHDNDGPDLSTDFLGDGGTLGNDIEVMIGGGDSGGPSFTWADDNNDGQMTHDELTLFGVNTFTGGGGLAGAPFYGSQGGGPSIAAYTDWLEQFVSFGEIEVSFNGVVIDDGSSFDFGVTALGQMITRTFTVRNVDNSSDLTLTEPINVPDEFTVIGSFGQTVLGPGQSTTFDVRFDSNPIGTYVGELSFESGDSDENPFNFSITAVVAPPIGEAGTVIADGGWTTVFLQNTYIDPVVVAGPATFNDADQLAVRVRNVTTDSFQIRAHEWSYLTGKHFNESIGYVVMESGVHRLSDGTTIIAQNTSGISTSFTSIPFELEFESTPIVLAQTVTVNGGAPVTTRLDEINPLNFQIKLQEEEAADQTHNPETIAWLAFLPSQENLGVLRQDADVTGFVVDENVETIPFSTNFAEAPVFIAGMQSFVGSNNATVRLADINANSASVFIEEEQSRDEEVGHGNENVGFMALQAGDIVGRTIIGEAGHIADLDRSWQTVNLAQDYLDPVIVFSTNSMNEADPGVIRVRNVTSNSFEVHFEEWNYLDLNHAPELVSFIVFESGIHRLRDGTIIEARNSLVDSEWADVAFTNDNGGVAPLVFSQIISENGPATATTRQQTITPDGFQIRLQEEEAAAVQNHLQESVSWIAVQEIRGDVGGVFYEALMHDDGVNHVVATTVPLTNTFDESPAIITAQQTTIGDNTATVRGTFISAGRIDLFVEEERSFDNEVGHVREDVAVFALSLGIVDGFIIDLFDDSSLFTPNRSLGLARSSASFDNAGNVENIGNDVIQQMLLARQDFDTLGDSAFEQLGQSTLIHVDIDEATTVRAGAVLLDDQNSNRDFDIRDQHREDAPAPGDSLDPLGDLTQGF